MLKKRSVAITVALFVAILCCALAPSFKAEARKPSLKETKITLKVGETYKLELGNVPAKSKVKYKTKDSSIVSISSKGELKAVSQGNATVKAVVIKKNGKKVKLSCKVTVSGQEEHKPTVSPLFKGNKNAAISKGFSDQATDFSVSLFKANAADSLNSGDNYLVSPLSVLTDMMMAANGADGSTLKELESVMCGSQSFEKFRDELSDNNAKLIWSDKVIFNMANSVWIKDDPDRFTMNDDFLKSSEVYFNAESFVLPFDSTMVGKVNSWVNKNTRGMIPELMNKPPEKDDVIHLINAIAFDAEWADQYADHQVSEGQIFTDANKKEKKVTMLSDKLGSYLSDDKAMGFTREYKGGEFSFVAILPDEGVSVSDYVNSMTGSSFRAFMASRKSGYDVYTKLPEFEFDYSTELSDSLQKMGINRAFRTDADFSKMATVREGGLCIGKVVHKTHIELDRKGTKAAAVTDIGVTNTTSVEPRDRKTVYIYLDRPFICAIVQNETGIPIFMGVVDTVK